MTIIGNGSAGTIISGAVSLASLVGAVASSLNMLPWPGAFAQASDFTNPLYGTTRASITTGISAPDRSENAQKFVENSGGGTHFVQSLNTPVTHNIHIFIRMAAIVKAAGRTRVVISSTNFEDVLDAVSIGFDLTGGNVGHDNVVGANSTLIATGMVNLGGGWWLCYFDTTHDDLTDDTLVWQPQIFLDNGTGTAARSISYTGDGSSGVDLWWFNMLPTVAWSMTNLAFQDDFDSLDTIDVNNTKAPGFKWYVNNKFPSSFMTTFGWQTNPPSAPTPASNLSISSPSVLKIYNPNTNQNGYTSQIWSVVDDGAGGYIGTVNKPPLVYDGYFNWDQSAAGFSPNWSGLAAFWGVPVEVLTNTGLSPTSHWTEWDVTESKTNNPINGGSFTVHDWSNPSSPTQTKTGGADFYSMTLGNFVRITGMWLPIDASGYGCFLIFANGQFAGEVSYTTGGNYSSSDNQHITVFLDTAENSTSSPGGGLAMYIDWVKVYTQ